jgi:hypothetical protein
MKGLGVKRWAASTIHGLGAMCALTFFIEAARAGSRFETIPLPSTRSAVFLDFTIVIPEVVYLGSATARSDKDTPPPVNTKGVDGAMSSEPLVVITNAGTLAFAQIDDAPAQTWEVGARGGAPDASPIRVYLVAMP